MRSGAALFVGDIGADLTLLVPGVPVADEKVVATHVSEDAGGVVANAAVACHLSGAAVEAVLAIGEDAEGSFVLSRLRERGLVVTSERRTGRTYRSVITVAKDGEKRLVIAPGVSLYPSIELIRSVDVRRTSWVHTAAYDPVAAAALADLCRRSATPWSIDLEPATLATGLDGARGWLAGAHTVFLNRQAADLLGPEYVPSLRHLGVQEVILTLGAEGARLHAGDDSVTDIRPSPTVVVDTTGAGDALAGWYIGRRLALADPVDALTEAVTAASLSCRRPGAQGSYPDRDAVLQERHSGNVSDPRLRHPRKANL